VLSHALWDEDAARDLCREHAVERLGAGDAVLVVDETGFVKKGRHSAGVARQYSGTAGKVGTLMFVVNTFGREATTSAAAATERKGQASRRAGDGAARTSVTSLYGAVRVKRSSSPLRLDRRPGRAASPRWDV
jgi:SRSO17 transposase